MEVIAYASNSRLGKCDFYSCIISGIRQSGLPFCGAFVNRLAEWFRAFCVLENGGAVMKANRIDTPLGPEYYFAALKLIEQLHKDGKLPAYIFRNILNDYADVVDLFQFTVIDDKEGVA